MARTAEANCIALQKFNKIIGHSTSTTGDYTIYSVNKEKLLTISKLVGTTVYLLESMLSFNEGNHKEINMIHKLGIQTRKLKFCPQCFLENGYLKKEWSITLITVCPQHHCELIDQCPSCGKYFPILRQSFLSCDCGFKLKELPIIDMPLNECVLSKLLYSKLNPSFKYSNGEFPIGRLNIKDTIMLLLFMGRFFELDKKTYYIPHILSSTTSNHRVHELMLQVVNLFLNWPINFNCFLDNYDRYEKRTRDGDKILQFATLRYGIRTYLSEKSFAFLEDGFNVYISKTPKRRFHRKGKRIDIVSDILTVPEASELLGGKEDRIHRLINIGKLKPLVHKVGRNEHIAIKRKEMEDYLQSKKNSISMVETQAILKTPPIYILQLLNEGIIQGEVYKGRGASFKKSTVDKLLSTLDRKAVFLDSIIGYTPLKRAALIVFQLNGDRRPKKPYSYIDVLKYILKGKIKVYRTNGDGLERYYLNKEQLRNFYNQTFLK